MNIRSSYINSLQIGGRSNHTIRGYIKDVDKFVAFFGGSDSFQERLSSITVAEVKGFYSVQKETLSPASVNALIRNLSAFFTWMQLEGIIEEDHPVFNVRFGKSKLVKAVRIQKPVLSEDEMDAVIMNGRNYQERFMIALMAFTALRVGSISNIRVQDIKGCEILTIGKGNKPHVVYMDDTLCAMMALYMTERKTESEYLFYATHGEKSESKKLSTNSINNRVKSAAQRAGISEEKMESFSAHRTRAFAITRLITIFGLDVARKVANHASAETTKLYDASASAVVKNALMSQRSFTTEIGK